MCFRALNNLRIIEGFSGLCARQRCIICPGEHDICCAGLVCIRMTVICVYIPYALVRPHRQPCAHPGTTPYSSCLGSCYLVILVSPSITRLFTRCRCGAPTLVYCRNLNCLTLLYTCTYYAPPPPAVRHCLMRFLSAASLLTTCHFATCPCCFACLFCVHAVEVSILLVKWSVICCQDDCFMVRQGRIAEEYLNHNLDEHCFEDTLVHCLPGRAAAKGL